MSAVGLVAPNADPVPSNAIIVSATAGNDSWPGTEAQPLKTVKQALRRATAGTMTTIVLREGVYRENLGAIVKPITLQPYPGEQAWFKGSSVVSPASFVADGARWRLDNWQPTDMCLTKNVLGTANPCVVNPADLTAANPIGGDPEMVFVDGTPQTQVDALAKVGANSFYWDSVKFQIFLGQNPAGHTVEIADKSYALHFMAGAENSVVRGLGFAQYATSLNYSKHPAALITQASGTVFENNTVTLNAAAGMALHASNVRAIGNTITRNGSNGLLSNRASNLTLRGNQVVANNLEDTGLQGNSLAGAGMKATFLHDSVISDNVFADNHGTGFWCDLACYRVTIVRNTARNNTKHGLYYEVSSQGLIASNLAVGNTSTGLKISGANHVRTYNNTFADNGQALLVAEDPRPKAGCTNDANNCPLPADAALGITYDTADVTLVNNIFAAGTATTPLVDTVDGNPVSSGKRPGAAGMIPAGQMDNNGYYRARATQPATLVNWVHAADTGYSAYASLPAFRATGRDTHGSYQETSYFVAGDYRLVPGSPAETAGAALPADVAAAIGVPATGPVALGALRWP
ncbi:parallel beta-helix repeat (two copies) [Goodfellowiella coeruleoviolacea]|uniref:Parallel beta-helix repeat (Two copies) n=2 Tax=Goodfellowiella coeruleoviolacea TaxID=334858 RepID=A0AAE3KGY6_9PSEU|nr:parallel beta-helix repeat (two copies) [Goodfellowiella coeruleoviolacea]